MAPRDFGDRFRKRALLSGLELTAELCSGLEKYYRLLAKWNSKINLTAFRLPPEGGDEAIDRLLLEPVAAVPHVSTVARSWLDAGSGGGSPAIPLKLALPGLRLHMVESKTRKAAFLREATRVLSLADTEIKASRFEMLLAEPALHESMDLVTVRAVRLDTATMLTLQAFLKRGGRLLQFSGEEGAAPPVVPPLEFIGSYPLLRVNQSMLRVFKKVRL